MCLLFKFFNAMKKLKINAGGMPLRLDDLDLIQTASKDGLTALIKGFINPLTKCIVNGLEFTLNEEDMLISVTEGFIFVTDELFYVPAASFTLLDDGGVIYYTPNYTTSELRTFHDTSTHNVWDIRNYSLGYCAPGAVPSGSITITDRLSQIQLANMITYINGAAGFVGFDRVVYLTGFTAATGYSAMRLEKNLSGLCLLIGAFNATVASGKIGVLPIGSRPTGDIMGYFFNWTVAPGVLKIKKKRGDMGERGIYT